MNSGKRDNKKTLTCKPLAIMRLTALLPPPPTPTTLILAESSGAKEELQTVRRWNLDRLLRRTLGKRVHTLEEKGERVFW